MHTHTDTHTHTCTHTHTLTLTLKQALVTLNISDPTMRSRRFYFPGAAVLPGR